MSERASRRERFLPYAYGRTGASLTVTSVELDGRATPGAISTDERTVTVDGPWEIATLELRIDVPVATLEQILPDDERAAPPLAILVVLRCATTRVRRAIRVAGDGVGHRQIEARMTLARRDLAGVAELIVYLVRTRARESLPAHASHVGARLAASAPWELRIDRKRPTSGNRLEVRYRRFSEDAALSPAERADLYRLESDVAEPVLWLNSDHVEISAALGSDATTGHIARVRDVVFDMVAASVWQQLFVRAALTVTERGEATHPWQDAVLDELLPALYPAIPDAETRLDRLRYEIDDLADLLARIDSVLQRRNGVVKHLTALLGLEV